MADALNEELASTSFGIVCGTSENRDAAWLNFEAGAIANAVGKSRVCPLLLGIKSTELRPPMSIFQAANATEKDIWELVKSLNSQIQPKLTDEQLKKTYAKWSPDLLEGIKTALATAAEPAPAPRDTNDLIQETLLEVREQSRLLSQIAARTVPSSEASQDLTVGDMVRHSKWGLGRITGLIGGGAQPELMTIDFADGVGQKMVMPKYAPLTKIPSPRSRNPEDDYSEHPGDADSEADEHEDEPDTDDRGD
jgi:hypothetical protein